MNINITIKDKDLEHAVLVAVEQSINTLAAGKVNDIIDGIIGKKLKRLQKDTFDHDGAIRSVVREMIEDVTKTNDWCSEDEIKRIMREEVRKALKEY